jgi:hypothetical protein
VDPSPIDRFDAAVEQLRRALDGFGEVNARDHLGHSRARLAETGEDLIAFAPVFREEQLRAAHMNAAEIRSLAEAAPNLIGRAGELAEQTPEQWIAWARDHETEIAAELARIGDIHGQRPRWTRRLHSTYKAMLYLIRAHQDGLAGSVYELILGYVPSRLSMANLANRAGEQHDWLEQQVPGYFEWFGVLRERRNQLKEGLVVHLRGARHPGSHPVDLGTAFTVPEGKYEGHHEVRVEDVADGIEYSARVIAAITGR